MALVPSEFWGMTPREFWNACDGYNKKEDQRYQTSWEQTRWLATIYVNALGGKKSTHDLMKFPWDKAIDRSEEIELIKERRKWLEAEH
jgi:hypothetical protein